MGCQSRRIGVPKSQALRILWRTLGACAAETRSKDVKDIRDDKDLKDTRLMPGPDFIVPAVLDVLDRFFCRAGS